MQSIEAIIARAGRHAESNPVDGFNAAPGMQVAFVACMDSRIDIFTMFGLSTGDAHVIRNAGGVITDDVVRSLSISQRKLGTRTIIVVQHTNCGLLSITDEEFAEELERDAGVRPTWTACAFDDVEENVRRTIRAIRDNPFIPHTDEVRGFVYDMETPRLIEISTP